MAAVEQNLNYQKELRAGDIVSIRSRVIEIKDKALRFEHEMPAPFPPRCGSEPRH